MQNTPGSTGGSRWRGTVVRAQLVDDLVASLCHPPKCSELEQQAMHNRLFSYAMRVADSGIASTGSGDPDAAFLLIKQRLLQQDRQDEAARFAELYQQLAKYDGLSSRGRFAILSLLQQLADCGAGLPASSIASYKPLQFLKVLPIRGATGAGAPDTSSASSSDQISKVQRSRAMQQGGAAAVAKQQPTGGTDLAMVKQPVLVKDVLRAVQGLTGRYNTFNTAAAAASDPAAAGSGVVVAPHDQLVLPGGMRTLLHELGELGLMYKRVQAAIAQGRKQGAGSVHQALCAALGEEVTGFYRLMAVLEAQLAAPQPLPGDPAAADGSGTAAAGPYLSLRRLQLWLAEPLRRMRLLAALVDGCMGRVGGDLAGAVWAASKVGDPLASSYATRILHQMCVPLFDMIRRWVFEGVLEDPACEFFIVPSSSSSSSSKAEPLSGPGRDRDLWRDAYRQEPAKLPPFINGELAATILRAGKSINFLRDACGDARWVQEWAPAAAGAAAALGYGQLPVLERVVVSAGRRVDARLMAVLHSTGELERHCQAIRRYLLMGQGDFVVALLDCLGPELSKPARDVSEVTLNHLLRQALLASAGGARGDEEGGAQERLRARKAAAGEGETGWDVFSLHYQLGPPLSSIFTPAAQTSYSQLSRLLWLLRRTERSLGTAWHTLKVEVERCLPRFSRDPCCAKLSELLRSCLVLRAEMAHFNINLQYYINLEVLECAWSEFVSAAAAAPDLDCLIAAHDKFLAAVLERALLGPGRAEGLRVTLTQLLKTCMSLAPLVARFNERVQAGLISLERRASAARANTAAGQWGSTSQSEGGGWSVPQDELTELTTTLGSLADSYRQLLRKFLGGLPEAANQVNAEVRFLLARLNFSDFYTRDAAAAS